MTRVLDDRELRRLMRLCTQRLEVDPDDPDALFVKAAILGKLGLVPAALHTLHRVDGLHAAYPGIRQFRARLAAEMEGR